MKYLKNKPVRIEGLNGVFIGRIMSSANYQNPKFDFETKTSTDINVIVKELESYVSEQLLKIEKEEAERKAFLLSEEGKKEEKINKFLLHTKRNFDHIKNYIGWWNNELMTSFYENDEDDYILDTGSGDPIWNEKAEIDFSALVSKIRNELLKIENNLKIKYNGSIEDLFYWDIPSYGYVPSIIDYNNEHILKNKKTKEFILNCELI